MEKAIGAKYKNRGKVYYFDPNGYALKRGDHVIVDTIKGTEYAVCVTDILEIDTDAFSATLRPVIKPADDDDKALEEQLRSEEREILQICKQKAAEHNLEMKLIYASCSFDGTKMTFFFTAEERVDFRELVRDLSSTFHKRIELRQIGIRDGAKMLGGLGPCGRETCCRSFLQEFHAISVKMAKHQGLSLNPAKISGICGNLMCCLRHEEEVYTEMSKNAPPTDSVVDTPIGKGLIADVNLLRKTAKVRVVTPSETVLKTYPLAQLGYTINGKYHEPTEEPTLFDKVPSFDPPSYESIENHDLTPREAPSERNVKDNRGNRGRNRGNAANPNRGKQGGGRPPNNRPNNGRTQQNKPSAGAGGSAKINIAEIAGAAVDAALNAQNGSANSGQQKRGGNRARNVNRNRGKPKDTPGASDGAKV
jgi:cell fate regulator YaaT (PSP1 superfamily)